MYVTLIFYNFESEQKCNENQCKSVEVDAPFKAHGSDTDAQGDKEKHSELMSDASYVTIIGKGADLFFSFLNERILSLFSSRVSKLTPISRSLPRTR